jgi:DNA repair protein RadA/Sms
MIIAVLEKRGGLRLVDKDVFVNVVGGIKLSDPSADAAIALAIASAHINRALAPGTLVLGELGLLGEFRTVAQLAQRASEAQRLGFTAAILPPLRAAAGARSAPATDGMHIHQCRRLDQAISLLQ